jgi:hypothetical protein
VERVVLFHSNVYVPSTSGATIITTTTDAVDTTAITTIVTSINMGERPGAR